MASSLPVMVEVAKPDGSQELVRVGSARREGSHFILDLSLLRIVGVPQPVVLPARPPPGSTLEELEYIATRARKTLADASKARWHAQEKVLLEQVEVELSRWKNGGS